MHTGNDCQEECDCSQITCFLVEIRNVKYMMAKAVSHSCFHCILYLSEINILLCVLVLNYA